MKNEIQIKQRISDIQKAIEDSEKMYNQVPPDTEPGSTTRYYIKEGIRKSTIDMRTLLEELQWVIR